MDISAKYALSVQNISESTRLWWLPPWNISCMAMNVRKTWRIDKVMNLSV